MPRSRALSPSDLGSAEQHGVSVAGRISAINDAELTIADALSQIRAVTTQANSALSPGDLICARGDWNGTTLQHATVEWHAREPLPQGHGEFARLAWQGVGRRLAARARAFEAIREYFREQGFIEVDTPLRVPAPGVDLHLDAIPARDGYLITSPEFHMKRLLVGGMPRIFQICHASRADEHGTLHEPEFAMLEWYRAFASYEEVLADTEQIVARVAKTLSGKLSLTLATGVEINAEPPFERLTVREAFKRYAAISDASELARTDEDKFFELMVSTVEPALAKLDRPVFLCEYPISQAALSRPCPSDPSVAERFELYAGGVELCNGYGELTDPDEQQARIFADQEKRKLAGRPVYPLDTRFIAALREGMPPSGGNALGIDRLLMLALGAAGIADVLPFPAERL